MAEEIVNTVPVVNTVPARDVPESVVVGTEPNDRAAHNALNIAGKGFWEQYGEPDRTHFMLRIGSDAVFATRVIENFLAEKFGCDPVHFTGISPDAPQENNVTGKLDHATYPPKVVGGVMAGKREAPGSGSERWGSDDWTQTSGAGLTSDTSPRTVPTQAEADAVARQAEAERVRSTQRNPDDATLAPAVPAVVAV